ncbi:MAG: hypothetical protein CBARDCOR_6842 [uncultured Caballeronia sp.]|nr:MAG: hypothetical protein CBARDCOR_6842 [uncultured Caballeronia sp.]
MGLKADPIPSGKVEVKAACIMATFIPEAWIKENAVEIDGRCEIDVTDTVLSLSEIQRLCDREDSTNQLVDAERLGHRGPYSVEIEESVRNFFGIGNLTLAVTEEMVARARLSRLTSRSKRRVQDLLALLERADYVDVDDSPYDTSWGNIQNRAGE